MNNVYFVCNVICDQSKDSFFSVGTKYEVIEKNDNHLIIDDHGNKHDAYMFNGGVVASCESKFIEH